MTAWLCLFLATVLLTFINVNGSWTPGNPVADPDATITVASARFTVLTPHLIRLEANTRGPALFENRQTSVVWNRQLPVPAFSVSTDPASGVTTISTSALSLRYNPTASPVGRFTDANLAITMKEPNVMNVSTWTPSMTAGAAGSLLGTFHSLDNLNGWQDLNCSTLDFIIHDEPMHCVMGLASTAGWAVVDDSLSPVVSDDGWFQSQTNGVCSDPTVKAGDTPACFGSDLVPNNPSAPDTCATAGCCWATNGTSAGLVELELWWSPAAQDNAVVTAAHRPSQAGYHQAKLPQPMFVYSPDRPQPAGSLAMRLWYKNAGVSDHWTTSTPAGEAAAKAANYSLVGTLGYMLPAATSSTKSSDPNTVPIHLFFSASRNDHFSTSVCDGCEGLYSDVRVQGRAMINLRHPCRRAGGNTDMYFFGHGAKYTQALHEWTMLAGAIPLPRRHMMGVSWSRWGPIPQAAIDSGLQNLTDMGIGVSTYIFDMNWHLKPDWTGYTWDTHLYPNHSALVADFHARGLYLGMNLHDAQGVMGFEARYPAMARAMGVDPASNATIPFQIDNQTFFNALQSTVVLPLMDTDAGFDMQWIDWQQGQLGIGTVAGASPTFLLNHLRFQQAGHASDGRRGLIHSRFPGWGGHRYPTQFGGDVIQTWESLSFMIFMTPTASNALVAWWGHEMMQNQAQDHELFCRVIQFGAFSPVYTNWGNDDSDDNLWDLPEPYQSAVVQVLGDRNALMPYRYTLGREAYDTGVGSLRPMYYAFPWSAAAYQALGQYALGESMIVVPIQTAVEPSNHTANATVWLPPGTTWVPFRDGTGSFSPVSGGAAGGAGTHLHLWFGINDVPVFVQQGHVLPMLPRGVATSVGGVSKPFTALEWVLYGTPAGYGQATAYEDDGLSTDYVTSPGAVTTLTYALDDGNRGCLSASIQTVGSYTGMPAEKQHTVVLRGGGKPPTSVSSGGKTLPQVPATPPPSPGSWSWDGTTNDAVIALAAGPAAAGVSVKVCF